MINILAIDDDIEITNLLVKALSRDNSHVRTAHNGQLGLQLLRDQHFDVVITDILMPETDGFEVIMAVKKIQPTPRLIVITGGSERLASSFLSDIANVFKVQCILRKPFTISELLNSVFLDEMQAEAMG